MQSQKSNGRPSGRPEGSVRPEDEIREVLRRLSPEKRGEAREILQQLLQGEGGEGHGPAAKPR